MKYINKFLKSGTPEEHEIFKKPKGKYTKIDYKIMSKYYSTKELKARYQRLCNSLHTIVATKEEYDAMNNYGIVMGYGPLFQTWEQYVEDMNQNLIEVEVLEKVIREREADNTLTRKTLCDLAILGSVVGGIVTMLFILAKLIIK